MRKIAALFTLALMICMMCSCQESNIKTVEIPPVSGNFNFTVLKSGQADAILMQTENHSIIVDCGEEDDGEDMVSLIKEKGISNIDYLFITHFDKDHVGGFPEVLANVTASNIIVPDYVGNNDEYESYVSFVKEKNLNITILDKDKAFTLDDVLLEVSVPKKQNYIEGDNDFSIVISITHGENTFLFAGDAEEGRLPEVLSEFGRKYDFLKVPHHGKHNKNTKRFINTVRPQYAVITDSDKHPASDKVISLLKSSGTEIYSSSDGDVSVSSDGKEIAVTQ